MWPSSSSVLDVLSLQDSKLNVAAAEKLSGALSTLNDVYAVSTFRLPPKLGGVLLGVYGKQDNRKYLEIAVMGKINKGSLFKLDVTVVRALRITFTTARVFSGNVLLLHVTLASQNSV